MTLRATTVLRADATRATLLPRGASRVGAAPILTVRIVLALTLWTTLPGRPVGALRAAIVRCPVLRTGPLPPGVSPLGRLSVVARRGAFPRPARLRAAALETGIATAAAGVAALARPVVVRAMLALRPVGLAIVRRAFGRAIVAPRALGPRLGERRPGGGAAAAQRRPGGIARRGAAAGCRGFLQFQRGHGI